jgi:hypothetical protein
MGRIICITGNFPIIKNGYITQLTEFVVSHGVDEDTFENVCLPCEHPKNLGAKFDQNIGEWVLE